jgi:outer membrane lipoprotein-sorting protein
VAFLILAAPPAAAQDLPVHDLMNRLARIPELRATFHEEKRLAALDRPLESEGRLLYLRPGHLEKITTAPRPERLVVDGETLTVSLGDEPPQVVSLEERPDLQALVDAVRGPLSGNLAILRRHYGVRAEGRREAWRLTLQPTDPNVLRLLQSVTIEGAETAIRSIHILQANGDEQRMTIENTP